MNMKLLYAFGFLVAVAHVCSLASADRVCPNRCSRDIDSVARECNDYGTGFYEFCVVQPCAGGWSCSFPKNSYLIPYEQFSVDTEMVIEYTWSPEQRDLDTNTRYMGIDNANVGFSCNNTSPYLQFGGDNSEYGGTEVAVIDFYEAQEVDTYDDSFEIEAYAMWHGSENQGTAQMTVYLRKKSTGVAVTGTFLQVRITPGTGDGCAATRVARVIGIHGGEQSRVTLESF